MIFEAASLQKKCYLYLNNLSKLICIPYLDKFLNSLQKSVVSSQKSVAE